MIDTETHSKVTCEHLGRLAYLYIRQSSLRQVLENTESTHRQYALRQRAVALGWPTERIVVIDCDQGQSGASAADREGFQLLVAEVGLGRVGIVLGLEVSRLARNNADWHRLLEICALAGTLILDEDGLYDPANFNDRLLLGLKGTMSEAELHVLRSRLRGGIISKARRGELAAPLPVGFCYDPAGKVVLDPDTAVREIISHFFATFARTGSARATMAAFAEEKLSFPSLVRTGPRKGELNWVPLRQWRAIQLLHNPRYAGAFFFGRKRQRRLTADRPTREVASRDQWLALIPDAHPGYITWQQFEANEARLAENSQAQGADRRAGPPREGAALLQGLIVCGSCGDRMTVRYHTRRDASHPEYLCQADYVQAAGALCQRVPGSGIDAAVGQLLIATLTPMALEVALSVSDELDGRAQDADRLRHRQVERAHYHADTARRRYMAVDPDNRLVADTLEADWNESLRELSAAQHDYEQARNADQARLSDEQRRRIMALAADFPALWNDPRTAQRERKRMIRLLIEDVTIQRAEHIDIHVRFKGGATHSLSLPVPLAASDLRRTSPDVVTEIDRLLNEHTDSEVATILNQRGITSFDHKAFRRSMIQSIRGTHQLPSRHQRLRAQGMLTITEIAAQLIVSADTINRWRRAGLLAAHRCCDRPEWLYERPSDDPPVAHQGVRLATRATATADCHQQQQGGAV
jgi:DNA invertase Pin-like site-specific DNA recombinase